MRNNSGYLRQSKDVLCLSRIGNRKVHNLAKKYLKRYQELATANGMCDPLAYLFKRYKGHINEGRADQAAELAKMLVPYGHGKIAPVDQNTGETVNNPLVINLHPDAKDD